MCIHCVDLCSQYLQEKLKREKGGAPADLTKKKEKEETIILRPLNMTDLKEAKNQVNPCFYLIQVECESTCIAAHSTLQGETEWLVA